jgi:hypothetical protein
VAYTAAGEARAQPASPPADPTTLLRVSLFLSVCLIPLESFAYVLLRAPGTFSHNLPPLARASADAFLESGIVVSFLPCLVSTGEGKEEPGRGINGCAIIYSFLYCPADCRLIFTCPF